MCLFPRQANCSLESACNSENRYVAEFSDLSVITPIHPLPSPGSKHVLHAFTEHKLPNITAYIYKIVKIRCDRERSRIKYDKYYTKQWAKQCISCSSCENNVIAAHIYIDRRAPARCNKWPGVQMNSIYLCLWSISNQSESPDLSTLEAWLSEPTPVSPDQVSVGYMKPRTLSSIALWYWPNKGHNQGWRISSAFLQHQSLFCS